jgi:hypothetical protein
MHLYSLCLFFELSGLKHFILCYFTGFEWAWSSNMSVYRRNMFSNFPIHLNPQSILLFVSISFLALIFLLRHFFHSKNYVQVRSSFQIVLGPVLMACGKTILPLTFNSIGLQELGPTSCGKEILKETSEVASDFLENCYHLVH